jgi:hypothetical protein
VWCGVVWCGDVLSCGVRQAAGIEFSVQKQGPVA